MDSLSMSVAKNFHPFKRVPSNEYIHDAPVPVGGAWSCKELSITQIYDQPIHTVGGSTVKP